MRFAANFSRLSGQEDGKAFASYGDHTGQNRKLFRAARFAAFIALLALARELWKALRTLRKGQTLTLGVTFSKNPPE